MSDERMQGLKRDALAGDERALEGYVAERMRRPKDRAALIVMTLGPFERRRVDPSSWPLWCGPFVIHGDLAFENREATPLDVAIEADQDVIEFALSARRVPKPGGLHTRMGRDGA